MKKVSTVSDRMKEALEIRDMRAVDIVERTGIPKSSISNYILGRVEPKDDRLPLIAKALRVNTPWLLGYDVPMDEEHFMQKVPVFEHVQAGDASHNAINYYAEMLSLLPSNPEDFFVVRVKGDSMLPKVADGDAVLVRKQSDVESGEIAVVLIDGEDATIKRVYKSEQGITLVADNPSVYPPRFYSNEEIASLPVIIQGKAEKRIGDLK